MKKPPGLNQLNLSRLTGKSFQKLNSYREQPMESIVEEQHPEIEPVPKPRVIKRRRPEMPVYDPEM
jgi:hypothetical protein